MQKLLRWAKQHRAAWAALAAGLAALGAFYALRGNRALMDAWLQAVSMPVKRAVSFLVDPLPFSACELGATALILAALVLLVRALRRGKSAVVGWVLHLAVLLVWGYAGVCALWGTQSYGTSVAQKAG